MSLYEDRIRRFQDALHFRPVDKIPVCINGPAFTARSQNILMKEFISDFGKAVDGDINLFRQLETADFMMTPIIDPRALSTQWYSPIAIPGRELPDNEMWQVVEQETFSFEDYEIIKEKGFLAFNDYILKEKLGDVNAQCAEFYRSNPVAFQRMRDEAQVPVLNDGPVVVQPFEFFCGGRTMTTFFCDDLFEEPEYMKEIFDKTMEELLPMYREQIRASGCHACWVGGWRSAPGMLSPDMWNDFVWPYMKALTNMVIEEGVIPLFHLDSNWDRGIERFKEFPKQSCAMMLDGFTDIVKAREILGDHMCLIGDVPAQTLAFGTPEDVRNYVTKILDACGPDGIIICSGCDIPANAPYENVKAMVDAATEYKH